MQLESLGGAESGLLKLSPGVRSNLRPEVHYGLQEGLLGLTTTVLEQ